MLFSEVSLSAYLHLQPQSQDLRLRRKLEVSFTSKTLAFLNCTKFYTGIRVKVENYNVKVELPLDKVLINSRNAKSKMIIMSPTNERNKWRISFKRNVTLVAMCNTASPRKRNEQTCFCGCARESYRFHEWPDVTAFPWFWAADVTLGLQDIQVQVVHITRRALTSTTANMRPK